MYMHYFAANELIEHFHCQLKTLLIKHPDLMHWIIDSLPIVLLGVHTQLEDDLQCTWFMVLCLPGGFFDESEAEATPDPTWTD